jgi:hypothetical protein
VDRADRGRHADPRRRPTTGLLAISGAPTAEHKKYLAVLGLKKGEIFSRSRVAASRQRVLAIVTAGNPGADVVPLTQLDTKARTIALTFEIQN